MSDLRKTYELKVVLPGLQKVSKIEETIRKNNEKREQLMTTGNWQKRQSIAEESIKIPPPPTQPAPAAPDQLVEKKLSRDEFSVLVNAIERLQLSNFFQVFMHF